MSTTHRTKENRVMNRSTTGTRPDDPITLLDDDDNDDSGSEKNPVETRRRRAPKTPRESLLEEGHVSCKKGKRSQQIPDGCMVTPKNPIKLFATDRDKVVRRQLRRKMTGNANALAKDEYDHHWSNFHCWTFREMLGFDRFSGLRTEKIRSTSAVGIDWIFITTYILDVDFLLNELPELTNVPIVVIVYQYKDASLRQDFWIQEAKSKESTLIFLCRDPRAVPESSTNPLKNHMPYGCHHTKMTLVGYSSGRLRVHIHTSNLRREDVHDKCQGAFLQDFFPKTEEQLSSFESSNFEESLVTYLESYDFLTALAWKPGEKETLVSRLQAYDFSSAMGVLIPSVPGYHASLGLGEYIQDDKLYGYLKVQKAIRGHCDNSMGGNIVCQFSSMGSLSKPYLNKIADAWNVESTTTTTCRKKKSDRYGMLTIVWPTIQEIVTSVEGPNGGASVPGRSKNLQKEFLRPLLHRWSSSEQDGPLGKGKHVPHIKSYYQVCRKNSGDMHWFVLSSHNLSKAAWGEIQNRRDDMGDTKETLVIQHWELGILLTPSTLGVKTMGPPTSSNECIQRVEIPLPYNFQPDRYKDFDEPWVIE